ncbi:MAG: phenylalanine--tRNA ligase subunit beta [Acidiferrobacterales bacterium]
MKFSEHWLKQFVNTKLSASEIADTLTFAGLEVDNVESIKPDIKKIVVGKIIEINPHPKADRLRICQVDVGKSRALKIVCGADNAEKGIKVATALVGAKLPSGLIIKKAQLRGEDSSGMLCSAAELGFENDSEGLFILDKEARIGSDILDVLHLDDHVIEIDLTPNRGDCLSLLGIAREMNALTKATLKQNKINKVGNTSKKKIGVTVSAGKLCPRYVGRVIEGINPDAHTPVWMQERLRRSGLRSLGPVVDVTNYVMLELGQPMHGFDLDKISGGIKILASKGKQKLKLLDETTVAIPEGTLLISDKSGPLAIAGIMGGSASAVTNNTKNIFLESAFFSPDAITGRARLMGKHTDSSHRFERGVDPCLQRTAIERATALLISIVGGKPGPVVEKVSKNNLPKSVRVSLKHKKLESILGIKIPAAKVARILKSLGMKVTSSQSGWSVVAPSYRFDIKHDVDLVEEVIRIYGYDKIPVVPFALSAKPESITENEINPRLLADILVDRDYQEVITYSFIDRKSQDLFANGEYVAENVAVLKNPISDALAVMRSSLWPGLVQAIIYNQNRQQSRLRFFETGHCFFRKGKEFQEINRIAGAITGDVYQEQWGTKTRNVDFFDMKGDLEAILGKTGELPSFEFEHGVHSALHPGKTAKITKNGKNIGWLGELHPDLAAKYSLETTIILFELDISAVLRRKAIEYRQLSKYPSIRRDISILVDEQLAVKNVFEVINQAGGKWLLNLELFDEYRGEGIDSGRKSLSLGLTLQESSRTLKEEEVETVMARVLGALEAELGAKLR